MHLTINRGHRFVKSCDRLSMFNVSSNDSFFKFCSIVREAERVLVCVYTYQHPTQANLDLNFDLRTVLDVVRLKPIWNPQLHSVEEWPRCFGGHESTLLVPAVATVMAVQPVSYQRGRLRCNYSPKLSTLHDALK